MSGFARSPGTSAQFSTRAVRVVGLDVEVDHASDASGRDVEAELLSECLTASPCGSRIPSLGRTSTVALTVHDLRSGDVVGEGELGQPLERVDVACARNPLDKASTGQLRAWSSLSHPERSHQSRTNCLSKDGWGTTRCVLRRGRGARDESGVIASSPRTTAGRAQRELEAPCRRGGSPRDSACSDPKGAARARLRVPQRGSRRRRAARSSSMFTWRFPAALVAGVMIGSGRGADSSSAGSASPRQLRSSIQPRPGER